MACIAFIGDKKLDLLEEYKNDLLDPGCDLTRVYKKYIMAGEVWYFKERFGKDWFGKYDDFKLFISDKLGVHFNDISVAGSAKLGFSINPDKNYKLFDDKSDLDIIIVSQVIFYRFWNAYLVDSYSPIRINNYTYVCKCIFRKFITFDGFNKTNKDYCEWQKRTKGFEKDLQLRFDIEHEIHYRIFESWEAAQMYYISGLIKNQRKLEGYKNGNN